MSSRAPIHSRSRSREAALTLVEVLVATTILLLLMTVLFSMLSVITRAWTQSSQRIDAFQGARVAFDRVTRMLSQATLNVYWDYDDPNDPKIYRRQSELAFAVLQAGTNGLKGDPDPGAGTGHGVFFQVPIGATAKTATPDLRPLSQTLTSIGFSVRWVSDKQIRPAFIAGPEKFRMRLMQYRSLSEDLKVYSQQGTDVRSWIDEMEQVPLADNIVWMAIWPRLSPVQDPVGDKITEDYTYNSRKGADTTPQPITAHQLPPTVQVTMIAIDERTAERFAPNVLPAEIVNSYADTLANVRDYEQDIETISTKLNDARINFRIFTTSVQLRESRWSP